MKNLSHHCFTKWFGAHWVAIHFLKQSRPSIEHIPVESIVKYNVQCWPIIDHIPIELLHFLQIPTSSLQKNEANSADVYSRNIKLVKRLI